MGQQVIFCNATISKWPQLTTIKEASPKTICKIGTKSSIFSNILIISIHISDLGDKQMIKPMQQTQIVIPSSIGQLLRRVCNMALPCFQIQVSFFISLSMHINLRPCVDLVSSQWYSQETSSENKPMSFRKKTKA